MQHIKPREKNGIAGQAEISSEEKPPESGHENPKGTIRVSRQKMSITLLLGILLITIVTVVVWALFTSNTSTASNAIEPGYVDVSVEEPDVPGDVYEIVPKDDGKGYKETSKAPSVKNNGPTDVWVRVMLAGGTDLFDIDFNKTIDSQVGYWIYDNNYWYYSKQLAPGETSVPLFNSVTLKETVVLKEIDPAELDILVYSEAVQANAGSTAQVAFDNLSNISLPAK